MHRSAVAPGGLELDFVVSLDAQAIQQAQSTGVALPPPIRLKALIDTGSDMTAVAGHSLSLLGCKPVRQRMSSTASGTIKVRTFSVSLILFPPGGASELFAHAEWEVMELKNPPPSHNALIGLDLLAEAVLILDGPGKQFILSF